MTPTAYNQFAKEIANYINYHCNGVDEGFEIEYEGFTAFVSYRAEIREDAGDYWTAPSWTIEKESTTVAAVWDEQGNEYPEIAEALQVLLNQRREPGRPQPPSRPETRKNEQPKTNTDNEKKRFANDYAPGVDDCPDNG